MCYRDQIEIFFKIISNHFPIRYLKDDGLSQSNCSTAKYFTAAPQPLSVGDPVAVVDPVVDPEPDLDPFAPLPPDPRLPVRSSSELRRSFATSGASRRTSAAKRRSVPSRSSASSRGPAAAAVSSPAKACADGSAFVFTKGTRVVRGVHWADGDADGGGPGTVTSSEKGVVWVKWDCDTVGLYNGGEGGRFDIRPLVLNEGDDEEEGEEKFEVST